MTDCVCDEFWQQSWIGVAQKNASIYEHVFRCIPTNSVQRLEDLAPYQSAMAMAEFDPYGARQALHKGIRGHLVEFPIYFLHKSDLAPSITTKEGLAPTPLFT